MSQFDAIRRNRGLPTQSELDKIRAYRNQVGSSQFKDFIAPFDMKANSRTVAFAEPPKVNKFDNSMKVGKQSFKDTLRVGWETINPFDGISSGEAFENALERSEKFREEQGIDETNTLGIGDKLYNFHTSAVDAASFGTLAPKDFQPEGVAGITGQIAGSLVPGVGIARTLRGTKLGANVNKNMTLGQKGLQYAKEGAVAGGMFATANEGIRTATGQQEFDPLRSAMNIGIESSIGAVADPAIMAGISGIGKGARRVWNSDAIQKQNAFINRNAKPEATNQPDRLTPELNPVERTLESTPYNVMNNPVPNIELPSFAPTNYRVDANFKTQARVPKEMTAKKTETPRIEKDIDSALKEYRDQLDSQIEYIRTSGGQGVNPGGLIRDELGEVVDRFGRTSNNPGWYREFFRKHGRAPNKSEQAELAREQLLHGFDDVGMQVPAWKPSVLENLDDQIEQLQDYYRMSPTENMKKSLDELVEYRQELETTLAKRLEENTDINSTKPSYNLTRRPVNFDLDIESTAVRPKQSVLPPYKADSATIKRTEGNYNSFRSKVDREPRNKKKFSSVYQKLRTQFVEDLAPLEKFEKNIRGKIPSAEKSVYKQARLFRGSPEKSHNFVRTKIRPIIQQVEKQGFSYEDLGDYALAKHAQDVNARGMNSGFTDAEIESVLARFETPEMEQARQELVNVSTELLKVLEDAQVLSKGSADFLRERWPNYMPLFRSFDDDKIEFGAGLSRSLANAQNPIKKLEGSDRNVIDPIESMVKNTFKTFNVADRNNVALQLSDLAKEDAAGNFIRRVDGDTSRKNVVSVLEDGKRVKYEVPPEVYETITNLNQESSNLLIKMLQKPASMLRAGATLDPVFSLRNPMRDIVQAFVVSKSGFNPITDFPIGLFNAIFKGKKVNILGKERTLGKYYQDFVNANGGYGNLVSMDRDLHRKAIKQGLNDKGNKFVNIINPNSYLNVLRAIADASETATKVGEFRKARRKGASLEEAAYQARDIMDFSRSGTSIREANKVVAFLNANIQGKSKLIRAISENPIKVMSKAATTMALPTIAFYVASQKLSNEKQKQAIDDAPSWMKETFWLLPVPGTDQVARLPKPFDIAPLANLTERALAYVNETDKHAFDGFAREIARGQALPVMMTGLAPFVEGMANYSFFRDSPIIPQREQNLEYQDQHDVNTTGTARFIAEGVNKLTGGEGTFKNFGSPRIVDNTIQGLTAGLGNYATSFIDTMFFDDFYDRPEKPAKDVVTEQTPLRGFLVNEMGTGQSMNELYELRDRLRKQEGSAKQHNMPFAQGGRLQAVESATKQIGEISTLMRKIENDKNLSGEEKRQRLEQLNQQRNQISRQAWEYVKGAE